MLLEQLGGDRLVGLLGAHLPQADVERPLGCLLLGLVRLRLDPGVDRRLQLLPDPGNTANSVGRTSGTWANSSAGSGQHVSVKPWNMPA